MRAAVVAIVASIALQGCAPTGVTVVPTPTTIATLEPSPSVVPTAQSTAERSTPVPRPTPFVPCPSPPASVGEITVVPLCVVGANVLIENALTHDDLHALYEQVTADLDAVQREFDRTLRQPPSIYVFATTASYRIGLMHLLAYSEATAAFVADNSVAFFEPDTRAILVNWGAVRERRPVAAIRHELTHAATLEACAPRCDLVPAWLNEGQARLAEATIAGGEWRLVRVRYEAASMAATNTLMPLARLVTQGQWNSITSWAGYYKYQQAARATELLREDIGGAQPIARLYERLRRGEDVARAYAALTGRSFDAFVRGLASRFAAGIPAGPAVVLTAAPQADDGRGYLLYGFGSEEKVQLRVVGRRTDEREEVGVSPQGAHFGELPGRYPAGEYTLTVTSGDTVVASITFEKRGGRPVPRADQSTGGTGREVAR
ncbi:MAG TPA: hypothetical protein VJP45_03985 [Candidatus Limnocylindria bacterium]|nr:hypothetical protein [Candidatus Limnocylindria bacterium]